MQISEEEKKEIEFLESDKKMLEENYNFGKEAKARIAKDIEKVLNIVEKKSKKLEIKDKMINYMSNYINDNTPYTKDTKDLENEEGIRTAKYTTKYFRKKVENE